MKRLFEFAGVLVLGMAAHGDEDNLRLGVEYRRHIHGRQNLRKMGGTGRTEAGVQRALTWLATHQRDDGHWGTTRDDSFALLAFLGAGYSDRATPLQNRFAAVVAGGLSALMKGQLKSGDLQPRDLRTHAIATLALCEAYWMSHDDRYKASGEKALQFLGTKRTQKNGTWSPDIQTNVWCLLAHRTGRFAGLKVDDAALPALKRWAIAGVGKTAGERAAVYVSRVWLGGNPRTKEMQALTPFLRIDAMKTSADWLRGTQALFQTGGMQWNQWNRAMKTSVLGLQRGDGSWGKVADTARYAMCLQIYYRHWRIFTR